VAVLLLFIKKKCTRIMSGLRMFDRVPCTGPCITSVPIQDSTTCIAPATNVTPPLQSWRLSWKAWEIFTYHSWSISRPKKLVTSPAFHGRWIGHTNSSDRPSNKHFAKRSFHLAKIKPSVHRFLQMTPKLSEKYVFIPRFSKRSLNFTTIY
jgi:hypothetical protein